MVSKINFLPCPGWLAGIVVHRNEITENRDHDEGISQHEISTMFNECFEDILDEDEPKLKGLPVLLKVMLDIEDHRTQCLVNSGSQVTAISQIFYNELLQNNPYLLRLPSKCLTLLATFRRKTKIKEQVYLTLVMGGCLVDYPFIVVPGLSRKIILGRDWMKEYQVTIKFAENIVCGNIDYKEIVLKCIGEVENIVHVSLIECSG